jgi:hypothetical protein
MKREKSLALVAAFAEKRKKQRSETVRESFSRRIALLGRKNVDVSHIRIETSVSILMIAMRAGNIVATPEVCRYKERKDIHGRH